MSSETQDLNVKAERNRRNVLKMGAIFGSVVLAGVESARGQSVSTVSPVAVHHCLLRGTRVLTAKGEGKVEDLAIGDLVPTMFGGVQPIQWIGHYPIKRSNPSKPWLKDARPVVCPAKAGMFSRRKACRGKSQKPRSLDSRVAGNQDPEAYRQRLPRGDDESPGRNDSERESGLESE